MDKTITLKMSSGQFQFRKFDVIKVASSGTEMIIIRVIKDKYSQSLISMPLKKSKNRFINYLLKVVFRIRLFFIDNRLGFIYGD